MLWGNSIFKKWERRKCRGRSCGVAIWGLGQRKEPTKVTSTHKMKGMRMRSMRSIMAITQRGVAATTTARKPMKIKHNPV
jgi:hypothetical protein